MRQRTGPRNPCSIWGGITNSVSECHWIFICPKGTFDNVFCFVSGHQLIGVLTNFDLRRQVLRPCYANSATGRDLPLSFWFVESVCVQFLDQLFHLEDFTDQPVERHRPMDERGVLRIESG